MLTFLKSLLIILPIGAIIYWVSPTLFWVGTCYFGIPTAIGLLCRLLTGEWPEPAEENPYSGPPYWGDPHGSQ
jgi:hypothetical protein